jgi:hypothetical protein
MMNSAGAGFVIGWERKSIQFNIEMAAGIVSVFSATLHYPVLSEYAHLAL